MSCEEGGMWQALVRTKAFLYDVGMLSLRSLLLCLCCQPACWTLLQLYLSSCEDSGSSRETCWLLRMLETKLL